MKKSSHLEHQNEKLSNKIGILSKMIEDCPI